MGTLNWSTKVPVGRTTGEVLGMLAAAGADEVMTRYVERRPAGVTFTLTGPGGKAAFALPIDSAGIATLLADQVRTGEIRPGGGLSRDRLLSAEHAERVAWRVAKDWLEAQLALVAARMVTFDQVMLPYLLVDRDTTLYARYVAGGLRELEAGGRRG